MSSKKIARTPKRTKRPKRAAKKPQGPTLQDHADKVRSEGKSIGLGIASVLAAMDRHDSAQLVHALSRLANSAHSLFGVADYLESEARS